MEWCLMSVTVILSGEKNAVGAVAWMTYQSVAENVQDPPRSTRNLLRHIAKGSTEHGAEAENDELGEMVDTDRACL